MTGGSGDVSPASEVIAAHYAGDYEVGRLDQGVGQLERDRSRELLERFLPPAPATVLDVGGGPGGHACWLAARGYRVHLVDITPLHVELARTASARQPEATWQVRRLAMPARSLPARKPRTRSFCSDRSIT